MLKPETKKILVDFFEDLFEKTTQHVTTFVFVYKYLTMITTKTTMKTNTTISSSIIALLMMMLFSHSSHAATIIPQNGTVAQLTPVYYEQTVEYYAEALADVETLVRFYISFLFFFSLLIRRNGRRTGRDAQKCVAIAGGESVAFLSRLVILVSGRRARLFLGALWMMMMMGVRNSKFRAGK